MRTIVIGILVSLLLAGCAKTQPQRPYIKGEERVDTTLIQMLDLNQRMASEADKRLTCYADEGYVLMETNYWVKGLKDDVDTLQKEDFIDLEAEFYTLQDSLLMVHNAQCTVGKVDEIQAVVDVIERMHRGQQVSLIVPWYMAFGSAGNTEVKPYENIRVELTIK